MLWIPGPTEVRPEILEECARPMIGHRSAAMGELIERIDAHLPLLFGFDPGGSTQAAVATSSATGLFEAALHGAGRKILAVVNGAFSHRWLEVARSLGLEAEALEVEWGRAVDPAELERKLSEDGPFDAVTVVSNETSTGVLTPLDGLGRTLAKFPQTLLLVDAVSLLAGAAVNVEANGVDFLLAGSQKALALPPGLALFAASERYVARAAEQPHRGWYLDPLRLLDGHTTRKTPTTPVIPLYRALARQLEDITAGVTLPAGELGTTGAAAWRARFEKHERMRTRTHAWAREHGCAPFPTPVEHASPTVSCLTAASIDVAALTAGLKERGYEISNGYGDLKGKTFRIGHMGDHTEHGLAELLSVADEVLAASTAS